MIKNNVFILSALVMLTGCSVVAGIFKAGVWVGVLVVVLVIAGIIALISKMGKK